MKMPSLVSSQKPPRTRPTSQNINGHQYLANHSACFGPFPRLVLQYEKTDKTIKETTEENHESIQTDRLLLSTGLALRDFVANDRGKDGERRSEWEGYRLKDSVSSK